MVSLAWHHSGLSNMCHRYVATIRSYEEANPNWSICKRKGLNTKSRTKVVRCQLRTIRVFKRVQLPPLFSCYYIFQFQSLLSCFLPHSVLLYLHSNCTFIFYRRIWSSHFNFTLHLRAVSFIDLHPLLLTQAAHSASLCSYSDCTFNPRAVYSVELYPLSLCPHSNCTLCQRAVVSIALHPPHT